MVMNDACERFYADGMARGLGAAHLGKYRLIMAELKIEYRRLLARGGCGQVDALLRESLPLRVSFDAARIARKGNLDLEVPAVT
jgi:hypothetical protein